MKIFAIWILKMVMDPAKIYMVDANENHYHYQWKYRMRQGHVSGGETAMKKMMMFMLSAMLVLTLAACGGGNAAEENPGGARARQALPEAVSRRFPPDRIRPDRKNRRPSRSRTFTAR